MQTSQTYKTNLVTFGRHTPKALRHQILCQLTLQFLGIHDGTSPNMVASSSSDVLPSLHRFHGALLFVDISGFTALSLRLKVEELKNHINNYFTSMLSIVDRWGGDVVKFAGDALYVVWKTKLSNAGKEGEDLNALFASGENTGLHQPRPDHRCYSKDFLDPNFAKVAMRSALAKATACGLEISTSCCNHEVQLEAVAAEPSPSGGLMSKIIPKWARSGGKVAPVDGASNVAYLNVHAGVSFGLMAGVDIGAHDRWEFFLIGDPLHRVAECEEQAAKGDVVICPESHMLLHSLPLNGDNPSSKVPLVASADMPCGCTRTSKGYFKITTVEAHSPTNRAAKLKRARSKPRLEEGSVSSDFSQNFSIWDDMSTDLDNLYLSIQGILKAEVISHVNRADLLARSQRFASEHLSHTQSASGQALLAPAAAAADSTSAGVIVPARSKEKLILEILNSDLRKYLMHWLQHCALEDIVKHVHEVARDDFFYEPKPRSGAFRKFLDNILQQKMSQPQERIVRPTIRAQPLDTTDDNEDDDDDDKISPPPRLGAAGGPGMLPRRDSLLKKAPSLNGAQFNALVKRASSRYLVKDTALTAEIRNVIVMFIKIVGLEMEITIDEMESEPQAPSNVHQAMMHATHGAQGSFSHGILRSGSGSISTPRKTYSSPNMKAASRGLAVGAVFDLLDRTAHEAATDALMLTRAQQCMEVLCKVFSDTGGQMRQFIVDDKGTVCIGTFGLKGSVGVDNAAAALETAKDIVIRLQRLGLTASIGITSGKAYCGLVGSPLRHEYAVMGPSTNLSARLMCKAPPFGVICDIETKNRDRTHGFQPLNEVQAKGYAQPVMTFKPIFEDLVHLANAIESQVFQALSPTRLLDASKAQYSSTLRGSQDWYLPHLTKSMSLKWTNRMTTTDAVESPRLVLGQGDGSLGSGHSRPNSARAPDKTSPRVPNLTVDLSGKHNVASKQKLATIDQPVFTKRRKSIRDVSLMKEELLKMNTSKVRLHGREAEVKDILRFLFPNISQYERQGSQRSGNESIGGHSGIGFSSDGVGVGRTMSIDSSHLIRPGILARSGSGLSHAEYEPASPARVVIVSGGEGTGKSALIDAVVRKIFVACKTVAHLSLCVFKNRPSSLEMHVPFHGLKPIIHEMLARIDQTLSKQSRPTDSTGNVLQMLRREIHNNSRMKLTMKESIMTGLALLWPSLPTEMQSWRPLLGSASMLRKEEDNEVTAQLQGEQRTIATIDLLVAIINAFPTLTKTCVLLVIEELQSLDALSRQVLFKVWRECSGVLIVSTQRSAPVPPSDSIDGSESFAEPSASQQYSETAIASVLQLLETNDPKVALELFKDTSHFKYIELQALSEEATRALILDAIPPILLPRIDDAFVMKICDASGGHPLYAYELTRGLVDKINKDQGSGDFSQLLADFGVGLANNRIEEMICYRFDQLDSSNQMILKAAAVACSNGAPFTLEMLMYILLDNADLDQAEQVAPIGNRSASSSHFALGLNRQSSTATATHTETMSVNDARETLEAILQRGEFIQICRNVAAAAAAAGDNSSVAGADKMPDSNRRFSQGLRMELFTAATAMEFRVILEQITIYNLLVDDQREFLHLRVASFYREKLAKMSFSNDPDLYFSMLKEGAYHSQHGSDYVVALKMYSTLASHLRESHQQELYNSALHNAYNMFISLKEENGIASYSLCSTRELEEAFQDSLQSATAPHIAGEDSSRASNMEHNTNPWTTELLFSIFDGSVEDVRVMLNVLRDLAMNELLCFEHPKFVLPVAEECLRIMLVLRNPHILANSLVFSSLLVMSASQSRLERQSSMQLSNRKRSVAGSFYLHDFDTFCAPLFFVYVLGGSWVESRFASRDQTFHSDAYRGKSRLVQQVLGNMMMNASKALQNPDGYPAAKINFINAQATCTATLLALGEDNLSAAEPLMAQVLRDYSAVGSHVGELELFMGVDLVGHTLAMVGQGLLLQGDIHKGRQHIARAIEFLHIAASAPSAALAVVPIITSLQILRDYGSALRVVDLYETRFMAPFVTLTIGFQRGGGGSDKSSPTCVSTATSPTAGEARGSIRSTTTTPPQQQQQQQQQLGLRHNFLQKLRVWLMCDRNQNSNSLELSQRLNAFSQLNSKLQEEVVREITHPQAVDGSFWPTFLMQCGLSLPAMTAMIFCCYQVVVQGRKLRIDGPLMQSLQEYAAKSTEEYSILQGYASIASKVYFYYANIKICSILSAVGLDASQTLTPRSLETDLLDAAKFLFDRKMRLGAALVASLLTRITRVIACRDQALSLQCAAVESMISQQPLSPSTPAIAEAIVASDTDAANLVLVCRQKCQLWIANQRLV